MQTTNSNNPRTMVTGLFPDRRSAEAAYEAAHAGTTAGRETELGNKAAEGAGIGGAIGGTVGAVLAAIAAVGTSLVLPGLGLVIAGPLAAAVAGAGAGAASGGLIGALIGWSIPEERVKEYEDGIKNGGILMGVRAKNEADAAHFEDQWRINSGQHIYR